MSVWSDQNLLFINLPTAQLLAIVAYGEAGNQGTDGMMAVLNVVRNRTLDQQYYDMDIYALTNDAYKAVALKKWQFSMFNTNDPVRATAEKIAKNFSTYLSTNSALQQAYSLAQMAVDGTLEDNTGGAQFYYNPEGVSQEPSWASVVPFLTQIGDHLFFGSGISAAVSSVVSTIEESATQAIGVMKEYSGVEILVLAGLGVGLYLELRKKKK
jgi:N-acetylmuramoyl-L-alanine amidase